MSRKLPLCRRWATSIGILLVAAGCNAQTITTSNFYNSERIATPNSEPANHRAEITAETEPKKTVSGIPFYMPQTVVHLKISGKYQKPDAKQQESQQAALDKANDLQAEPRRLFDNDPKDPALAKKLPELTEAIQAATKTYEFSVSIAGIEQVADPTQIYLLEYHTQDATDDTLTIGVNAKGLLNTATAISTDRSGDIIKKVAETFATVAAKIPTGMAPDIATIKRQLTVCQDLREFTLDWTQRIDGSKQGALVELQNEVYQAMTGQSGTGKPPSITMTVDQQEEQNKSQTATDPNPDWPSAQRYKQPSFAPGLRFRVPVAAQLSLTFDPSAFEWNNCGVEAPSVLFARQPLIYLDRTQDFVFDMRRTPLVKSTITLTVVDGVLTEAQVSRDSPALAAASLPLDLINLLLSPITTLIHGPTPADDGVKAGGS